MPIRLSCLCTSCARPEPVRNGDNMTYIPESSQSPPQAPRNTHAPTRIIQPYEIMWISQFLIFDAGICALPTDPPRIGLELIYP